MSSFNLDVNVADVQFVNPDPESGDDFARIVQVIGLMVPVGDPRQGQAAVIGLGSITTRANYDLLTKIIEGATAARELLPEPAHLPKDFVIAGNEQQATQFARQLSDAQGGKIR
jgi:hypothetical protein